MRKATQFGLSLVMIAILATGMAAQDKSKAKRKKKAPELLPDSTLMYFQIDDINELKRKFSESTFGKMIKDEKMRPFVQGMMDVAKESYEDVKGQVADQELSDLFNLPQGEICFGLVGMERGNPVPIFFIDVDPESETHKKLIERGTELAKEEGATAESEEVEGIKFHTITGSGGDDEQVTYFQHEGTYVFCMDKDILQFVWLKWQDKYEGKQKTLAEHRKFITIMNRCRGTKDAPPEFSFYIDPIDMYKAFTKGNAAARLALAFLPTLGLDGLLAVGGSVIYDEQGYDSIFHGHILLASPRSGIFKMIALKPGVNDPEPWVPQDCISYMTMHWNAKTLYSELTKIVDAFSNDGAFEEMIDKNINQQLDIDFEEDLIKSLDGRITLVTWSEPPARLNSQSFAISIKIKDMDKFKGVLDKFMDMIEKQDEGSLEENRYKGKSFWATSEERKKQREESMREFRERRRRERGIEDDEDRVDLEVREQDPAFMILDEYLIIADSKEFLKHIIEVSRGEKKALAEDEDYKKIIKEMEKLLSSQLPSITFFNRPSEQMRTFFEAAKSENTKALMSRGAEQNKYVQKLKNSFEDSPLPDFEHVKKYFPPAGGFVVSDDSGFHFLAFSLKPDLDEDSSSKKKK